MDVCFNSSQNSYVVFFNLGACVDPFGPIAVGVDASGVLEGDTKNVFMMFVV